MQYNTTLVHEYLSTLDLPPVLSSHGRQPPTTFSSSSSTTTTSSSSSSTASSIPQAATTAYTSTTGQADGSSGYGNESLSSDIHTEATAPDKFKYKFKYYFQQYPEKLRAKLKMDEIASFSVTEAGFAEEITLLILKHIKVAPSSSSTIVDATACVGGNSMSFLQHFGTVYAVELDRVRQEMLAWNLGLCKKVMEKELNKGKLAKVSVFCGDFLQLMAVRNHAIATVLSNGSCDVVFLDPPWGGRKYGDEEKMTLTLGSKRMYEVCNAIRMSTKYTVMKLPKNYDVDYLEQHLHASVALELVRDLQNNRGVVKMKIVILRNNNVSLSGSSSSSHNHHHPSQFLPTVNPPQATNMHAQNATKWNHPSAITLFQKESQRPQVRGIYAVADEPSVAWRSATSSFANPGCPAFTTKEECIAWCKHVRGTCSNPDIGHLQHMCTTLIGWAQVQKYLLEKRDEYMKRYPSTDSTSGTTRLVEGGRYRSIHAIRQATQQRLNALPHRLLSPSSSYNTLRYLYFHMRSGLYVMIRNSTVQMFVPFVNNEYTNTYSADHLNVFMNNDTQQEYYNKKWSKYCRTENIIPDRRQWWANANILCNELGENAQQYNWWGDSHLAQLRDMLESL